MMYDSDGHPMNRKQQFKYLFDRQQDDVTLTRVLHAEWLLHPAREDYELDHHRGLSIGVRCKGGGIHNIAWLPWGFSYEQASALVEARNKTLRERDA